MPVVTRSQAKSNSKADAKTDVNDASKVKATKSNAKTVPLHIWFAHTIRKHMSEMDTLNNSKPYFGKFDDRIKVITKVFNIINTHYENVLTHFDNRTDKKEYYDKLTKSFYTKAIQLRREIVKKNKDEHTQSALNELAKTIKMVTKIINKQDEVYVLHHEAEDRKLQAQPEPGFEEEHDELDEDEILMYKKFINNLKINIEFKC